MSQRADEASDTARRFVTALADNDTTTVCHLVAPKTARSLTADGSSCEQAVGELELPSGRVRDSSVWSDRAQVRTDDDTLFLVELVDGWHVAAAGCDRAHEDTYECKLESG